MKKIWTLSEFEKMTGVKRKVIERLRGDNGPLAQSKNSWIKKEYNQEGNKVITEEQLFEIAIYLLVMSLARNKKGDKPRNLRDLVGEFKNHLRKNRLDIVNFLLQELDEYKEILLKISQVYIENDIKQMIEIIKSLN